MSRISQREARRLRKLVKFLEQQIELQRRAWGQEYISAVEIGRTTWDVNDVIPVAVRTARKLKHAVVIMGGDDGTIRFMALPHPKTLPE